MPLTLFAAILGFASIATLMGIAMCSMLYLIDLEHDYINPFDAVRSINRLKKPELALHAFYLLCMMVAKANILFSWQFLFMLYQCWRLHRGNMYADVTSIFKVMRSEKQKAGVGLGIYFAACLWTVAALVRIALRK